MEAVGENIFKVGARDAALPARPAEAHKGDFGRVLIVAGSRGFTGAPSFAAHAAVRTGAGLVFLAVPGNIYEIEAVKNDEAMVLPLPPSLPAAADEVLRRLKGCDAALIGPGLGLTGWAQGLVTAVLESSRIPLVLDADGITALARHIDILDKLSCPLVLTPHEGEFARISYGLRRLDRVAAAREFSQKYGVITVLKGHETVTAAPGGRAFVNTTGNPGMATGGSGDVLAGMILALLGQGLPPEEAAYKAVYLHGLAGDWCAERYGQYAMTPTDMIDALKFVLR